VRKRIFRGERLRQVREERNLSQDDLAQRAQLGEAQMHRYETGKADPSSEVLVRLAKELEVTTDFLLGLTDVPDKRILESELSPDERRLLSAFRRKNAADVMHVFTDHMATES